MKNILLKTMSSFFIFCIFLLSVIPQVNAQVPEITNETANLLRSAKIHVLDQTANPVNFTLPLLGGGNAELSSYKGKIVILNFWATWCPPCRAEMPSMETLYQRFKNEGLEILAVDIGEDTGTVRNFIQNSKYTFPVLLDSSGRVSRTYGIQAIPTSFILDRGGKIIAKVTGSIHWDTPQAFSAFEALLTADN